MSVFEWSFLFVSVLVWILAVLILAHELNPTNRLHARKMRMLHDISRGVGR